MSTTDDYSIIKINNTKYFTDIENELDKKYNQLLFKPGFDVQSREMNLMQMHLQEKLKNGFNTVWKNGTIISGCNINIVERIYIKILYTDPLDNNITIDELDLLPSNKITVNSFNGDNRDFNSARLFIGDITWFKKNTEEGCYEILVNPVKGQFTNIDFSVSQDIFVTNNRFSLHKRARLKNQLESSVSFQYYTYKYFALLGAGKFYYNGIVYTIDEISENYYFNFLNRSIDDFITLYESNNQLSKGAFNDIELGFVLNEKIITSSDDNYLKDVVVDVINSDGADRLQQKWELKIKNDFFNDENNEIVFLSLYVINGFDIINKQNLDNKKISKEMEDLLAKRTFDVNGNFFVNDYSIKIESLEINEYTFESEEPIYYLKDDIIFNTNNNTFYKCLQYTNNQENNPETDDNEYWRILDSKELKNYYLIFDNFNIYFNGYNFSDEYANKKIKIPYTEFETEKQKEIDLGFGTNKTDLENNEYKINLTDDYITRIENITIPYEVNKPVAVGAIDNVLNTQYEIFVDYLNNLAEPNILEDGISLSNSTGILDYNTDYEIGVYFDNIVYIKLLPNETNGLDLGSLVTVTYSKKANLTNSNYKLEENYNVFQDKFFYTVQLINSGEFITSKISDVGNIIINYVRGFFRIDYLILNKKGLQLIKGVIAETEPDIPFESSEYFKVLKLTTYPKRLSLDTPETIIEKFDSPKFTMDDIKKIENRVDELELDVSSIVEELRIKDREDDGSSLLKGILYDNFVDKTKADVENEDFNVAFNLMTSQISLPVDRDTFSFDDIDSPNNENDVDITIINKDIINLSTSLTKYENEEWIGLKFIKGQTKLSNEQFSSNINLNPFGYLHSGKVKLNPRKLHWSQGPFIIRETQNIIENETVKNTKRTYSYYI